MRTYPTIMAISLATAFTLLPARAESQTSAKSSQPEPVSRIQRAIELEELAIALHGQPARAVEAARLHKQSASLRNANDPEAVQSLAMAAHLFGYGNRTLEARRTMEQAADRALAMGDVVHAAKAYVEATFFADKLNNQGEMDRLGRKALLLARSPLLTADERTNIIKRIRSNPSLASLVR
jgi:hypothetical protein